MIIALILGGLCLVLLTVLITWMLSDSPVGPVLRTRVHRKVVVTTKTGSSFRGVLVETDRYALVLRQTEALGAAEDGSHVIVDGELIVLRADIDYVQVP